jgi:succinate dehydrogenase / fumarate reductase, membrane anchor subunit
MSAIEHKAKDLGSSHSGVSHFWRQRVSAAALVPLSVWFAVCVLGLVGAKETSVLVFLQQPLNALLMGAFVLIALYHMALGLQEVIVDYIPHEGFKIFLVLLCRAFAWAVAAGCAFAILRIAVGTS